ncbi:hypothetical protein [Xanthobacter versatilis]|uniref:hypothetical protein n=1 Tax=Xanthobacter autotrophicus (strain ATCC BAA-1158 / Py2) TaxID=78245 RepID=UPI00372A6C13
MSDLPVHPLHPVPGPPAGEDDEGERNVSTPVSIISRVVADGGIKHKEIDYARMTLVTRPTPPKDATVNLRCWPSEVLNKLFKPGGSRGMTTRIRVVAAMGLSGKDDAAGLATLAARAKTVDAEIMWTCDQQTSDRIDRFWRRVMNPLPRKDETRTVWEHLVEALTCDPDETTSLLLPTPHGAAALAFTLGRGRMLLDALAAPGSPLAARDSVREDANFARPWYQGERRTQLASLIPDIELPAWGQSAEDEEYWAAPYRKRTAALLAGEVPDSIWPSAQRFAAALLAGGSPAAELMERVHAAHHLTTPANPAYPVCSTEDEALDTARRRLGALLGLPTLQRLFGFAFDLLVGNPQLQTAIEQSRNGSNSSSPFILLAPDGDDGSWTLARYEAGHPGSQPLFCPASWDEMQNQRKGSAFGLRNLGETDSANQPRYDIITIDPGLATESDINHAAKGDAEGSALSPVEGGIPVLHNGGLRVIVLPDQLPVPGTGSTTCPPGTVVHDADDMKAGDRLMIGIAAKNGLIWRSPDYRSIRFEDPWKDTPQGWVEKELSHRLYPADARRRLQLDGGMAIPALQKMADIPSEGAPDPDQNPLAKKAIRIIADCTVALWGSDPAGVPPPGHDKNGNVITRTSTPVIEELDVTRSFSAPSSRFHHPPETLSPSLRFGWPYYTVLANVFEGGSCANPVQVGEIVGREPSVALPNAGRAGRRFLRHERVNAPMSLIIESDFQELNQIVPPQRGADMYVRTASDNKLNLSRSRRLITPPPVPLQFAMLHDVLRSPGQNIAKPRAGLTGLALLGRHGDKLPNRVRVSGAEHVSRSDSLYYPDPAASIMALGLKLPQEKGLESAAFVEQPVAIPVGARTWPDADAKAGPRNWPDVTPVHVELKAVGQSAPGSKPQPRIVSRGLQWLTTKEKVVSKPEAGAVQVQSIEIHLQGGEDLLLQIWCVPTINQLADWFDSVEAAGVLALSDNPSKGDADAACIKGLERLLGADIPQLDRHVAAVQACVGAGGLQAPPRRSVLTLAGLTHRELLMRPLSVLASPLTMRVTHVIDDLMIPKPVIGPKLAVTRRVFSSGAPAAVPDPAMAGETPADFLNKTPISDWGLSSTQEGATSALFGGNISFDPTSTSGLIIEAHCAAPFGEALDPETGRTQAQRSANDWNGVVPGDDKPFGFKVMGDRRVDFPRRNVAVLKLDGLPLPADGRAGLRTYPLEELMAGAWGDKRQFGEALRAALPAALSNSGARRLWLRAVPINRHAGLLPAAPAPDERPNPRPARPGQHQATEPVKMEAEEWIPSEPFHLWLPATTRPAPPVIDHVNVALSQKPLEPLIGLDGSFTVGIRQTCILTVWQARPFPSSGEGEMIALVLWPPGLFSRGIIKDGKGADLFPTDPVTTDSVEFYDEDMGPGGAYVTRWAADPLTGDKVATVKFPTGPLVEPERLSDDGVRVPRALMPVPVTQESWAPVETPSDKGAPKATDNSPNLFLAVALQAFEPRFDPMEELWYVNVALRTDPLAFPRVRLGLVRYQPNAREDDVPPEGSEPVRLRVSTPVTEWVKPLPGRRATATCRPRADGKTEIVVVVDGPSADPDENKKGIQTRMVVEVVRHRTGGGVTQEETARDNDGAEAACSEWSTDPFNSAAHGLIRRLPSGCSWTCMFLLPGQIEDNGWSHSVVVTETREINRANPEAGDAAHGGQTTERLQNTGSTGPHFVARIKLEKAKLH